MEGLQLLAASMSSRQTQPSGRDRHAAVGIGHKLYVWGGDGGDDMIPATTIESFDVFSEAWQQPQQLSGDLVDTLWDFAVTTDGESAYFFGGWTHSDDTLDGFDECSRLYKVDLSTLECRELVPGYPSYTPTQAHGNAMVYFNKKLILYGWWEDRDRTDDRLHVFDLTTGECRDRFAHALCYYCFIHCILQLILSNNDFHTCRCVGSSVHNWRETTSTKLFHLYQN